MAETLERSNPADSAGAVSRFRFLAEHQPFHAFVERLYAALIGDDTGPETLVQAAMLSGAIGSAVQHPLVAHLDDATLRSHLLRLTRRLIDLPA
jgi:hypothetical protein